jgi:isocitrate lyase
LAYAPYAGPFMDGDKQTDLEVARAFAEVFIRCIQVSYLLITAHPSFNWSKYLDRGQMQTFREELAAMGYRFNYNSCRFSFP